MKQNIILHKNDFLADELQIDDNKKSTVFITTFESVVEDNKTVIKAKNKKLTQRDNVLVEEVVSEEDETRDEPEPTECEILTIEEVSGDELIDDGKFGVYYKRIYRLFF